MAAVLLATSTACSAGKTSSRSANSPTIQPPKDFRVTFLSEATNIVHGVAISSNGERALTSSVEEAADPPHGSVSLWDLSDPLRPRASALIPDRGGTALKVALSGDGRHAVTTNLRGELTLWDLSDPSNPTSRRLAAKRVTSLALNYDGRYAISGGDEGVHFWDLTNPNQPRKEMLLGMGKYSTDWYEVAISADAKRALVSHQSGNGEGGVMVYDLSNPANPEGYSLIRNADYHSSNTVALSGDGNTALVGYHHWTTYNNFVTYWDLRTWDKTELRPMTGWKITPDTGGSVVQWEIALNHDGKRALIAQRNDPAPKDEPNPPRSEVQLWALDTLAGFPRFSPTG
ncbi:LVIVD repeat-containing protein [Micromonospora sp. MW-13]|uniref:LVIVD repeat-containing protein n=1 Tax=Micromonospora sp. MW-13 TaxID=2094022 RepID=UPI000FFEC79B|nr:WD40 repeat domain-containing protein [Micromonospora sp. MW-13]